MDRVFMGKISTFCRVNWNKLIKKFVSLWNYADKQGTTYILRREIFKFQKGSMDTCGQSKMYVFNDFLKFYYSLLYADVLLSELE
jgi:hypothetical protein